MATFLVPYHQDERLPDDSIPVPGVDPMVVSLPDGDIWSRLVALFNRVAASVAIDLTHGSAPVVFSGDCLTAIGTLTGAQRAGRDPGIVWFDAHGDVHTLDTSTSGYLGGLALRLVLGAHADLLAQPLRMRPLREDRAVLVDARDLDPAEVAYLAEGVLKRVSVDQVGTALPDGELVLHIDLDVIDTEDLPGMRFPAPGGPRLAAVFRAAREVVDTGRVVALSIACPWHPAEDDSQQAARVALINELAVLLLR